MWYSCFAIQLRDVLYWIDEVPAFGLGTLYWIIANAIWSKSKKFPSVKAVSWLLNCRLWYNLIFGVGFLLGKLRWRRRRRVYQPARPYREANWSTGHLYLWTTATTTILIAQLNIQLSSRYVEHNTVQHSTAWYLDSGARGITSYGRFSVSYSITRGTA